MRDNPAETPEARAELDAVIVGARFSGIDMPHWLRGLRLSVRVGLRALQRCGWHLGVESTLARCDVEIMDYSYSFLDGIGARVGVDRRACDRCQVGPTLVHRVAD